MTQALVVQTIRDLEGKDYPAGYVVDLSSDLLAWLKGRRFVDDTSSVVAAAIAAGAPQVTHAKSTVASEFSGLVGAHRVRSMLSAIRTGAYQRVNLGFHGHSIVQGVCSDDTANFNLAAAQTWRQRSLASLLSRALNGAVGGAWAGGIETMALAQRDFFTLGGAATFTAPYGAAGPGGYVLALTNATDTATITAAGTAVRFYGYAANAGVVARYSINGGAAQNVAAAPSTPTGFVSGANTLVWYDFTVSGLTAGDTVQLMGPAAGSSSVNYRIYAVDPAYVTTAGITVQRLAVAGNMGPQTIAAYLDNTDTQPANGVLWNSPTDGPTIRAMQTESVTTRLGLSGLFNMFDVNDIKAYNYSGQAWGWSLTTLERHMRNYLNAMDAKSLPVIVCLGPLRDPNAVDTAGTPYTQADIINLYKEVVDSSNNAAYIDLTQEFTGATLNERYSAQLATSLFHDAVHPGGKGAAYLGAQRAALAVLAA